MMNAFKRLLEQRRRRGRTDTASFLEAVKVEDADGFDTAEPVDVGPSSEDVRSLVADLEGVLQAAVAKITAREDLGPAEKAGRIKKVLAEQEVLRKTLRDALGGGRPAVEHFAGSIRQVHGTVDDLLEEASEQKLGRDLGAESFARKVTRR